MAVLRKSKEHFLSVTAFQMRQLQIYAWFLSTCQVLKTKLFEIVFHVK